ncbi:MAG: HAD hydrolase-like protein [Gemmataceae bacterium]|nr:HAD hydrolase-like protein [Gemmataceae bacterium]
MTPTPRVVVFDFDGTLVASNEVKRDSYFRIFADVDPDGNGVRDVLRNGWGEDNRLQVIGRILGTLAARDLAAGTARCFAPVVEYADRYNEICETHQSECPEVPGASACLAALASRHSLFVNSATLEGPLRRAVARRGWNRYFSDVLGSPASKIGNLRALLDRQRVGAWQVVVVGDGRADLAAAQECGCRFIGIRNAFNDFEAAGVLMLPDLRELPQVLDGDAS